MADCSESNFCSGRGNCTDGMCTCPPGYVDANCSIAMDCKFFDELAGNWSSDGVTTEVSADGRTIFCDTTHLTTFGGILSVPTSVEELTKELRMAIAFNSGPQNEATQLWLRPLGLACHAHVHIHIHVFMPL